MADSTLLTDFDMHLLGEGRHYRSFEKLGAHIVDDGVWFRVWAPFAQSVSVVGDFNEWNTNQTLLFPVDTSGIWARFVPGIRHGDLYKYCVVGATGRTLLKADPLATYSELRPRTASRVWDLGGYAWNDQAWLASRASRQTHRAPISIYELHLGSWRRDPSDRERLLTYQELSGALPSYLESMGYTHVEFMPLTEHPFDGSWGYQTTGYYAATSRYGTPQQLMELIDALHQKNIGVILDWAPAHFPKDDFGLARFDGTCLYEHEDPRMGEHKGWGTLVFNFGRPEVSNFLISSALFWLEKYHIDGLRVDAVSSMLYRDYQRPNGEWIANDEGGRENLEAIAFLKHLNHEVYAKFPGVMMVAEEATPYPLVSAPTYAGGLGFGFKWNMGWMNDVLDYVEADPSERAALHHNLTFGSSYVFTENYILPFSHDEVVHLKKSMLDKMPRDVWQKFANLRALLGFMLAHPGKKLMFMGTEIGQWAEWDEKRSLDWHLLDLPQHNQLQRWIIDLNLFLKAHPALYELDSDPSGFRWLNADDAAHSAYTLLRTSSTNEERILFAANFSPEVWAGYRAGVPTAGLWREALNSDSEIYGGGGQGNMGFVATEEVPWEGMPYSVLLTLPPLSAIFFVAPGPSQGDMGILG